jgi:opacity protein-like surface antigen
MEKTMKLVKSSMILAALGLSASMPGFAQDSDGTPMLDRGTQELSLAGRLEFPDFDRLDYDLNVSYGYFFADGWEVGTEIGASDFGGVDRADISAFTEYNFNRESWIVPYIGAGIGVATVSFDDNDFDTGTDLDDGGLIFDVETGVKWFIKPYMAISTAIDFQVATDDIYATDDAVEDNLTSVQVGMRFYF